MSNIQKLKKLWALVMQPQAVQATKEATQQVTKLTFPEQDEKTQKLSDALFDSLAVGPFSAQMFAQVLEALKLPKEQLELLAQEMNAWMFGQLDEVIATHFLPGQLDELLAYLESPLHAKAQDPHYMANLEAKTKQWQAERLFPLLTAYRQSLQAQEPLPFIEKIQTNDSLVERLFAAQKQDPNLSLWVEAQLKPWETNEATALLRERNAWGSFKEQLSSDGYWRRFLIESRRDLFSEQDLIDLINFYESSLGSRFLTLFTLLNAAADRSIQDGSFQATFQKRIETLMK
jgi:hypothetical protein